MIDGLGGRTLYVDRPLIGGTGASRPVAGPRVSREMLRAIIDDLGALDASIADYRAAILGDAGAFKRGDAAGFDAAAFARRVASLPEDNATRRAFDLCGRTYRDIDASGLTPIEVTYCKREAVKPLADQQAITTEQLVESVEAYNRLGWTVAGTQ
jgi:hypothetical protein